MHVPTSVPDADASGPDPLGRRVATVLTVLACVAQALVLFATFVMGLGWGGLTYLAALVQAGLAFGLIGWLAAQRRTVVVLVPVASAALTAGLAFAGQAHGRATACSDQALAAAQQLSPPPGTTVEFEGQYGEGCVARVGMRLSSQEVLEHYQAEFARLGWQETPGRHDATIGTAAVKDGIHMLVDINAGEQSGAQMIEVLVGDPTSATPCTVHTVDGYLERTPTRQVEPGQWVVLASTGAEPASVVIRDSTAAVVFEQRARPRPDDDDDLMRLEEASQGLPFLSLDEGDHSVECTPAEGATTTVPLRVAWASPAPVEQEKSVVLRVFETPDHWR